MNLKIILVLMVAFASVALLAGAASGNGRDITRPIPNGYSINTIEEVQPFSISLYNQTINITLNFLTPTDAGLTINSRQYNLSLNDTALIGNTTDYSYYVELVNISFIPIGKSVGINLTALPKHLAAASTMSTTSTIPTTAATTMASTTMLQQNIYGYQNEYYYASLLILIIVIVALYYALSIRHRVPPPGGGPGKKSEPEKRKGNVFLLNGDPVPNEPKTDEPKKEKKINQQDLEIFKKREKKDQEEDK